MRHKSVLYGRDSEALQILLEIHCSVKQPLILDCTYNRGTMWKGLDYNVKTLDIDPSFDTDYVGDFRNMHFIDDNSFDVLIFDPPHLPIDAASPKSSRMWEKRYGITNQKNMGRNGDNINDTFLPFLFEAKRVLKKNGIVLAKISDIVHNHQYQWQHVDFVNAVRKVGMTPCDLLIKIDPSAGGLTSSKWKNVKHLRRAHSYWIVSRKGRCECPSNKSVSAHRGQDFLVTNSIKTHEILDDELSKIATGRWHNLGLKTNGSIVAWRNNRDGECDVPEPNRNFAAVSAGESYSLGLKKDGSIVAWGKLKVVPSPNIGFTAIAAGWYHSLGLKKNGSIVAWGRNDYNRNFGQCNVPSPNTGFVAIAAGHDHSLGIKNDNSIIAWGWNQNGQCNVPEPNRGFVAVSAGGGHSLGLKDDSSIVAWGFNAFGQCDVPELNTGFVAVAAGDLHSLGLKKDGSIVAWGGNDECECDILKPNTSFMAVAAGDHHSLSLRKDGSIMETKCNIPKHLR